MCCVDAKSTVLFWGRGKAGVEDVAVDASGDTGPEEVAFCADDALFCPSEMFFCSGEAVSSLPAFYERCPVSGNVSGGPDVVEA